MLLGGRAIQARHHWQDRKPWWMLYGDTPQTLLHTENAVFHIQTGQQRAWAQHIVSYYLHNPVKQHRTSHACIHIILCVMRVPCGSSGLRKSHAPRSNMLPVSHSDSRSKNTLWINLRSTVGPTVRTRSFIDQEQWTGPLPSNRATTTIQCRPFFICTVCKV